MKRKTRLERAIEVQEGKFLGGITKPKPFVYLDELTRICKEERLHNKAESEYSSVDYRTGRKWQIERFSKAARKIAKERGKK